MTTKNPKYVNPGMNKEGNDCYHNLLEAFERIEDACDMIGGVELEWTAKDCGFGRFYFYHNDEGQLCCDSETMGKEFIKRMLCQMVDDCELT